MLFKVVQVLNKETIKIFPKWCWSDLSGNIVGIRKLLGEVQINCDDCDELKTMVQNKIVELKFPEYIHQKKLLCDVHLLDEEN